MCEERRQFAPTVGSSGERQGWPLGGQAARTFSSALRDQLVRRESPQHCPWYHSWMPSCEVPCGVECECSGRSESRAGGTFVKTQKSPFRPPLSASSPQEWVVGGRNGGRCFVSMRSHPHERRGAHSASCPVALLNPPHTSPFESRHHQHEQTCPLPPTHKSMTNRRERGGVSTWVAATTSRPQHLCYPVQLTVLHRNRRLQDSWVALFYCSSSTAVLYFSGTKKKRN